VSSDQRDRQRRPASDQQRAEHATEHHKHPVFCLSLRHHLSLHRPHRAASECSVALNPDVNLTNRGVAVMFLMQWQSVWQWLSLCVAVVAMESQTLIACTVLGY